MESLSFPGPRSGNPEPTARLRNPVVGSGSHFVCPE